MPWTAFFTYHGKNPRIRHTFWSRSIDAGAGVYDVIFPSNSRYLNSMPPVVSL